MIALIFAFLFAQAPYTEHSTWIPEVYKAASDGAGVTPLVPYAGSIYPQDFSVFGPWLKLTIGTGRFQIREHDQTYLVFSFPPGKTLSVLTKGKTQVSQGYLHIAEDPEVLRADIYTIDYNVPGLPNGNYIIFTRYEEGAFPVDTPMYITLSCVVSME